MNAKKEAEYIAEIVRLKSELKKASKLKIDGEVATPKALKGFVSWALNQINDETDGDVEFGIVKHKAIHTDFYQRECGYELRVKYSNYI